MNRVLAALVFSLVVGLGARSPAALIASRNLDGKGGLASTVSPTMTLGFGNPSSLLDVDILTTSSPSGLYTFDSSTANFAQVVALLTNGANDSVNLWFQAPMNGIGLGIGTEAATFYGDRTGALGVDFSGRTIDSISFEVDAYYLKTRTGGTFYDLAIYSTLRIYGSGSPLAALDDPNRPVPPIDEALPAPPVPEPSTFALGALGLVGLAIARRRFLVA